MPVRASNSATAIETVSSGCGSADADDQADPAVAASGVAAAVWLPRRNSSARSRSSAARCSSVMTMLGSCCSITRGRRLRIRGRCGWFPGRPAACGPARARGVVGRPRCRGPAALTEVDARAEGRRLGTGARHEPVCRRGVVDPHPRQVGPQLSFEAEPERRVQGRARAAVHRRPGFLGRASGRRGSPTSLREVGRVAFGRRVERRRLDRWVRRSARGWTPAWLPTVRCSSSIDDTPVVAERGSGCGTRWRSDAACATCRCERSGFTGLMRTSHCRGDRWNSESAGHAQPILPPQGRQVKESDPPVPSGDPRSGRLPVDAAAPAEVPCSARREPAGPAARGVRTGHQSRSKIRATAGGGGTGR